MSENKNRAVPKAKDVQIKELTEEFNERLATLEWGVELLEKRRKAAANPGAIVIFKGKGKQKE